MFYQWWIFEKFLIFFFREHGLYPKSWLITYVCFLPKSHIFIFLPKSFHTQIMIFKDFSSWQNPKISNYWFLRISKVEKSRKLIKNKRFEIFEFCQLERFWKNMFYQWWIFEKINFTPKPWFFTQNRPLVFFFMIFQSRRTRKLL